MEIAIAAETITHIGPLPLTNTLLLSWIVIILLSVVAFIVSRQIKMIPNRLQNIFELIIEVSYGLTEDIAGFRAKVFFPFIMTFFLFIITGNWLGLLPGFGTIGFWEGSGSKATFVPLLRSIDSDLNTTLALALISAIATHFFAIKYLGLGSYLKRWVSRNPIYMFVGILEIVSEFTKIISLSFRLFGNIFAGEVVLATIAGIFAFVVPLPFYFLEIVVGFVQAAVFMMLTLTFMAMLSEKHSGSE